MNEPWRDRATGKIFCPENDWDCPYLRKDGSCVLKHVEACEVFYSFWENDIKKWWFSNKSKEEGAELW